MSEGKLIQEWAEQREAKSNLCLWCKHRLEKDHGGGLPVCRECHECRHELDKTMMEGTKRRAELDVTGDAVNHPSHYTMGGIEVIDAIEAWGLSNDYCLGNVIKYVARAKHKGTFITDLEKAIWYLKRRIREEKEGRK